MTVPTYRFLTLIFHSDLHGIRILLGFSEILWALTLLWHGNTFDRPIYTIMSNIMREESWGLIFLISGISQFSIVYKTDYTSKFSTYFAGWNAGLWLYVVISMYLSISPPPAAISGDVSLAIGAAWVWIRTGHSGLGRRHDDSQVIHGSE